MKSGEGTTREGEAPAEPWPKLDVVERCGSAGASPSRDVADVISNADPFYNSISSSSILRYKLDSPSRRRLAASRLSGHCRSTRVMCSFS